MTEKICYLLRIAPGAADEYLARHEQVWPELLLALRDAGIRNYSVFLDRPTGLLALYLETDDYAASAAAIASTEVQAAWSRYMDDLFIGVDDERPVGTIAPLEHAFDLDAQLRRVTE